MRAVVCFEIPAFEIAIARLEDSSLKDRAVAVAPLQRPQASLQELSREAFQEGLTVGMSVSHARRLCPSLRVIAPDPLRVRTAERELLSVIGRFAPVWEPVLPGSLFLDLTGTFRLFGPAADTAARLEREVSGRYGLTAMMGVASNKLVSQAAAAVVQPSELCDVLAGCEPAFMAPWPISSLSRFSGGLVGGGRGGRTVWNKMLGLLEDLNLRTLGDIAAVPLGQLEHVCGPYARLLRDRASGIDLSPVFPPAQRPQLQLSGHLEPDEVDDGRILGLLYGLMEGLGRQLRQQGRMCTRLRLTLTHTDQEEVSGCWTLRAATYWEVDMFPALHNLFYRLFQRRVRLRRLTLSADQLGPSEEQLSLFTAPLSRMQRLTLTLDSLRDRFGPKAIAFGRVRREA